MPTLSSVPNATGISSSGGSVRGSGAGTGVLLLDAASATSGDAGGGGSGQGNDEMDGVGSGAGSAGAGVIVGPDWLELANASSSSLLPSWLLDEDLSALNETAVAAVNGTASAGAAMRFCEEWQAAQHLLFQSANLCCALAFMVPHTFRLSGLLMRTALCAAYMLFAVWAGLYVCAPDIFVWNVAFLVINATHALYLAYRHCPPRVHPELRELYTKLFLPLNMDKKHFKQLVGDARILALDEGTFYAEEWNTSCDDRLSILLRGRLKVTYEDTHLHYIYPHHFIDSPEWEASPPGTQQLFQVTIMAVEPCRYLCWSRCRLQQVLKMNSFLDAVVYNLVGKDITYKLYSLNETLRGGGGARPSGDWSQWPAHVPRSISVDAVHTGTRGQVRSHLGPPHLRRNNSASVCSDSLGSSPARTSRYSHLSDPGPSHGSPTRGSPYRTSSPSRTGGSPSRTGGSPIRTGGSPSRSPYRTAYSQTAPSSPLPVSVVPVRNIQPHVSPLVMYGEPMPAQQLQYQLQNQLVHVVAFETPV